MYGVLLKGVGVGGGMVALSAPCQCRMTTFDTCSGRTVYSNYATLEITYRVTPSMSAGIKQEYYCFRFPQIPQKCQSFWLEI